MVSYLRLWRFQRIHLRDTGRIQMIVCREARLDQDPFARVGRTGTGAKPVDVHHPGWYGAFGIRDCLMGQTHTPTSTPPTETRPDHLHTSNHTTQRTAHVTVRKTKGPTENHTSRQNGNSKKHPTTHAHMKIVYLCMLGRASFWRHEDSRMTHSKKVRLSHVQVQV